MCAFLLKYFILGWKVAQRLGETKFSHETLRDYKSCERGRPSQTTPSIEEPREDRDL